MSISRFFLATDFFGLRVNEHGGLMIWKYLPKRYTLLRAE